MCCSHQCSPKKISWASNLPQKLWLGKSSGHSLPRSGPSATYCQFMLHPPANAISNATNTTCDKLYNLGWMDEEIHENQMSNFKSIIEIASWASHLKEHYSDQFWIRWVVTARDDMHLKIAIANIWCLMLVVNVFIHTSRGRVVVIKLDGWVNCYPPILPPALFHFTTSNY